MKTSHGVISFWVLLTATTAHAQGASGIRYATVFETTIEGGASNDSVAEKELMKVMMANGAIFISEAQSRKIRAAVSAKDLVGRQIPETLTSEDADLIIAAIVRVNRDEAGNVLSQQLKVSRYQASIEAAVIAVDTAEVLDPAVVRGLGIETSPARAIQLALQDAGKALANHILSTKRVTRRIEIVASNVPLASTERLKTAVLQLPGARSAKLVHATPAMTKLSVLLDASAPSNEMLANALDQSTDAGVIVNGFSELAIQATYSAERAVRIPVVFGQFSGPSAKLGAQLSSFVGNTLLDAGYISAVTEKPVKLGDNARAREKTLAKLGLTEKDGLFLRGEYFDRGKFIDIQVELRSTRIGHEIYTRDRATCTKDQLSTCTAEIGKRLLEKLPAALLAKRTTGTPATEDALVIKEATLESDIFPARAEFYRKNGIGHLKIQNTSKSDARNGGIRVSLPGVTKDAVTAPVPDIAPGAIAEIEVPLAFDEEPKASRGSQLVIEVGYDIAGRRQWARQSTAVEVLPRYAMNWIVPASIASFVTTEGAIRELADAALQSIPPDKRSEPLARPAAVFRLLAPVQYQRDRVHPGRGAEIDEVQLPVETLARRLGDCEDLAVLYAAFLEAVGVETVLILTPGHILTAVNTGVPAQAWSKVSVDFDDVIVHRGRTFVPIETTKAGSSFADAWREGAQLAVKSKREAIEFEIVDVREAWRDYPVATFRSVGTVGYKPSLANVGAEIEALISARAQNFEKIISEKNVSVLGAVELSTHAMLLSAYGRTQEARDILVKGVAKYPRDAALTNNLANVELARNEIDGAIALYGNAVALAAEPDGAVRIHLNTAIAARMKGDHALSLQKISAALDRATTESAQRIVQDFLASIGGAEIVRASESAAFEKRAVAASIRAALEKRGTVRADEVRKLSLADIVYWLEPTAERTKNK